MLFINWHVNLTKVLPEIVLADVGGNYTLPTSTSTTAAKRSASKSTETATAAKATST